jgi:hypothetical protein
MRFSVLFEEYPLGDHRPLGDVNRRRRDVDIASAKRRAQTAEPTGYPRWPQ